jgi:hypothetical protein
MALPCIAMGYRMSKHASLSHFSPYFLFFGRHPIPPPSIAVQMDQVMDLDSLTTWAKVITERATLQKGYAHGHGDFVHCIALRHLTMCTHTRWQLQT